VPNVNCEPRNRRRNARPSFLEDGHESENESADHADHQERKDRRGISMEKKIPGPSCRRDNANQQQTRLVDGALEGHRVAESRAFALECLRVQRRVRCSHQLRHSVFPFACVIKSALLATGASFSARALILSGNDAR
jgi:hypothetical protein